MTKSQEISSIYKILILFEKVIDKKTSYDVDQYITYLKRLRLTYKGIEQKEFCALLQGLIFSGKEIEHSEVKSTVFFFIDEIQKGKGLT